MNSEFRVVTVSDGPLGRTQQISYRIGQTTASDQPAEPDEKQILVICNDKGIVSRLVIENDFTPVCWDHELSVRPNTEALPTSEIKPKTQKPKRKRAKKNKNPRLR